MNRRDFLKGAGAAAIVPAAIPGVIWNPRSYSANSIAAPAVSPTFPQISAVVYDERYADCRLFADALVRHGAIAFPAHSDSAQLWYGQLRDHLARHPGRVAGFTTYADFSVSQSCGRELSLITLYEAAHDSRASRTVLTHRLRTTGDETEIAASFTSSALPWAESLANALCRVPSTRDSVIRNSSTVTTPRSRSYPGYLNSWLLAPRQLSFVGA
jgi:TAT (twin-arginine translocation) pathway-exported protein